MQSSLRPTTFPVWEVNTLGNVSTDKNAGTGVTSYTARECKTILPVIQDRLLEAEKDNHNIYQETVPRTFKDIEAKQLARVPASLPASMMVPTKALFLSVV